MNGVAALPGFSYGRTNAVTERRVPNLIVIYWLIQVW